MSTHEKFSFVRASSQAQKSKKVVHLRERDELIFCNHEINDYFQSKYFPNGKYSRPTQLGVNNGYFFRPNTICLPHYLCQ